MSATADNGRVTECQRTDIAVEGDASEEVTPYEAADSPEYDVFFDGGEGLAWPLSEASQERIDAWNRQLDDRLRAAHAVPTEVARPVQPVVPMVDASQEGLIRRLRARVRRFAAKVSGLGPSAG